MNSRCRLCAESSLNLIPALENEEITSKISELFHIEISFENRLPTTICPDCYNEVEKTWLFFAQVNKAQQTLLEELTLSMENVISESLIMKCELSLDEDNITSSDKFSNELINVCNVNDKVNVISPTQSLCQTENDCNERSEEILEVKPSIMTEQPVTTINKENKGFKKKQRQQRPSQEVTMVNEVFSYEFTPNEDGSINPEIQVEGWNSYPWACCECQDSFSQFDKLYEHYAYTHNSNPRYLCVDCQKVYSKYTIFIEHVSMHREILRYCCDICFKWYPTVISQSNHRSEHKEEKAYSCNTCGKRFRLQWSLLTHIRSHLPDDLKNSHQCNICAKGFRNKSNLLTHKRIHLGIKEFVCHECGKCFMQKGTLDSHILTHSSARLFTCTTCGKSFKTSIRLKKHGKVHSGLKPYKCDVCNKEFREKGTLKEHRRIHTGDMPFTCDFCGKCFRFKGILTTHRRQHTGERPYSCNECQHHFTNWPNYNKHMKRRHGINTSVNCRTKKEIPPTGLPSRNPPSTVLASPQQEAISSENYTAVPATFYPVLNIYSLSEDLLQQKVQ